MKNHSLGLVVLTIAAAMACGCAAPARPHAAAPLTAPTLVGDLQSTMEEHADAQLQLKGDATLYVLVLSGGGANGAWGAGVLNGWNDGGDVPNEGPIPKWDAVTGISTGALQGTAALLGNYKLLEKFYTTVKTSDVVTANFFGNQLLAAISIYDSSPLRKLLATVINDDIIDQVAEQATAGRKFYVGTVDLVDGRLYVWDMTWLALKARASRSDVLYDRYRDIILASTSVPAIFPGVTIDNDPHFDGGTRAQLFFQQRFLKELVTQKTNIQQRLGLGSTTRPETTRPETATAPSEPGEGSFVTGLTDREMRKIAKAPPPKVYVVVNGFLGVARVDTAQSAVATALRGVDILEDAARTSDVFAIKEIPGLDFKYVAEPADAPPLTDGTFDGKEMTPLYNLGVYYGKSGLWRKWIDFSEVFESARK
jgi:predicted patatin/cPLA2 family phospholipase